MRGRLEWTEIDAGALAGNALGDPPRRPLLLYLPPGAGAAGARLPAVYFLHGFTGSVHGWTVAAPFAPTVPERLDALVAAGAPPAIGVFLDGFTALGGTQWIDSPAIGDYQRYVAEVVALVDARRPTVASAAGRAVVGRSSGGYGALALGRDRPDLFGHLAAHAPDSGFEYCYLPDLPRAAAALLDVGPVEWLAAMTRRAREEKLRPDDHAVLNVLAMSASYSPAAGAPLGLELPFEPGTGRLRDDVWARWLAHDPARWAARAAEALGSLETLFLDCGTRDELSLRWGVRSIVASLRDAGVPVLHEEFEDGHRGVDYRFDRSLSVLLPRLARG